MDFIQISIGIAISFILGIILIPILIKLSYKYNFLDLPGKHKRHKKPTPIIGGIGLFFVFWITFLILKFTYPETFFEINSSILYIFLGSLIILLVGLADDIVPLSAWVKLAAQISSAIVIYLGGLQVELVSSPWGSVDIGNFSIILTIIWVIMLTNSINLIDGLDGLASGVSLIGSVILLIISVLYGISYVSLILSGLIGFLIIFLYYNKYPARIFLGDSGSMQIGYYFAVFSLIFPMKSYALSALYIPLVVLAVPIIESVTSFFRRLISGKKIMVADRRHLFHYLTFLGFSSKQVLTIFYILAIIFGLFALGMFFWNRLILFGLLLFFMVVIFVLFFILLTKITSARKK